MRFKLCLAMMVVLIVVALLGSAVVSANEIVKITAWTIGPDTPAFHRAENLLVAAERLNQMLEATGADVRVEVEADFWTDEWDSFRRRVILASEEANPQVVPDIILSSHLDVPVWAPADWIVPLDHYIEQYWESTYQDFFPHLWDSVSYDDKIWAVPQDIEVRMVFYRKDHLRSLGWTEAEIADLARKVAEKEFLLNDLVNLGLEMKNAGLVDWGMIHRPTAGPDFFQYVVAFGGEYFDPSTGQLVVDKDAVEKTLTFFHDIARTHRITPDGMTTWPWPAVHRGIAEDGSAGMQITGGMWFWAEWQRDFGLKEEDLWDTLTWSLIPAGIPEGTPNQLGHPLAYMVTKPSLHKELAFLLITLASEVDLNTRHALEGAKLAIRQSQTAFGPFIENRYLAEVSKLVPDQIFTAAHPASGQYASLLHEMIGGVQSGAISPSDAVNMLIQRLQRVVGNDLIIR